MEILSLYCLRVFLNYEIICLYNQNIDLFFFFQVLSVKCQVLEVKKDTYCKNYELDSWKIKLYSSNAFQINIFNSDQKCEASIDWLSKITLNSYFYQLNERLVQ